MHHRMRERFFFHSIETHSNEYGHFSVCQLCLKRRRRRNTLWLWSNKFVYNNVEKPFISPSTGKRKSIIGNSPSRSELILGSRKRTSIGSYDRGIEYTPPSLSCISRRCGTNKKKALIEMSIWDDLSFLVFSENKNERICVCGYPEKKHKHAVEALVTKWSIANNTFERIDPKHGPIAEGALVSETIVGFPPFVYAFFLFL